MLLYNWEDFTTPLVHTTTYTLLNQIKIWRINLNKFKRKN